MIFKRNITRVDFIVNFEEVKNGRHQVSSKELMYGRRKWGHLNRYAYG